MFLCGFLKGLKNCKVMETLGEEGLGDRSHLGLVTPELVHRVGADPPISSAFRFSLPGSFVVKYKAERINITICCKVPGFEGNECRIWKCRIFNPRISPEIGDSEALSKEHPFANSLLRIMQFGIQGVSDSQVSDLRVSDLQLSVLRVSDSQVVCWM